MRGGDHKAVHARPAGLARLREAINTWPEETGFRTALAACVAALVLTVSSVAIALLASSSGGHGTVAGAAPSDPAGTAGPSAPNIGGSAAAARYRGPFSVAGDG